MNKIVKVLCACAGFLATALLVVLSYVSPSLSLPTIVTSPVIKNQSPPDSSYVREEKSLLMGMYGGGIEFSYNESQIKNATWGTLTTEAYFFSDTGIVTYGGDTSGGVIKMPASMPSNVDWSNFITVKFKFEKSWTASDNWTFNLLVQIENASTMKNDVYCDFSLLDNIASNTSSTSWGKPFYSSTVNSAPGYITYSVSLSINQNPLYTDGFSFKMQGLCGYNYGNYQYNLGYANGYDSGYGSGNSAGYSSGYSAGDSAGHDRGYGEGLSAGTSNFGIWDLFSNAFGSVANVLGIQIFPGVSVGLLVSVPIAFAFILWLIHTLKG